MRITDMIENYEYMISKGIHSDRAAIMAGMFAIANALDNGFSGLLNDKALGALDLHTVHIENAITSIAESIDNAVNNQ